jgi:hypothetical protein
MSLFDRLGRLARLAGIVGISLGSLVIAACGGSTKLDGDSDMTEEGPPDTAEGEADAPVDPPAEEVVPDDVPEEPDTDMWEQICE